MDYNNQVFDISFSFEQNNTMSVDIMGYGCAGTWQLDISVIHGTLDCTASLGLRDLKISMSLKDLDFEKVKSSAGLKVTMNISHPQFPRSFPTAYSGILFKQ